MKIIFIGLLAALGAMIIDRYLVTVAGNLVIIYLVPVIEELFKSLLAYFWQVNIPLVHLVFGALEAIYDFYSTKNHGFLAGGFGLLGHSIFGYVTWLVFLQFGNILVGVLAAVLIHTLWNYIFSVSLRGNE